LRKRVAELEARLKKIPSRGRRLGKKS
jgi:hypothetical protein